MNLKETARQTGVIFSYELKQSFKDWKVVLILFIYIAFLVGSLYLVDTVEGRVNEMRARDYRGTASSLDLHRAIENEFGSLNFIVPFIVSFVVIPLTVLFLTFDVISSERYHNSIRYLITRTSTFSILIGKFLANLFVMFLATFVFYVFSGVYFFFKFNETLTFWNMFYPWIFLTFFSAAMISFITFLSTFPKSSAKALGLGFVGIIVMNYMLSVDWLKWFSIFNYLRNSFRGTPKQFLTNFVGMSVLTVVFLILANIKLKRTDL
ncbi:ABC transporter permease subunit [Candidatus Woesearchaeota archaeon]|nr:ABC transporter permease subunit [Candidatus Woesearchaeota archaeon]